MQRPQRSVHFHTRVLSPPPLPAPPPRRIILAQLEGSGRGALGSYNSEAYVQLSDFLESEPLKDGDAWVARLMRCNSMLGERRDAWVAKLMRCNSMLGERRGRRLCSHPSWWETRCMQLD